MKNTQSHKVALVTGSARRVGAAIVRALHAQGYHVIVHYRHSKNDADALVEALNQARPMSAYALQADFAQPGQCQALIQAAHAQWQRLDVLVNNASEFFPTPVGEVSEADWQQLQQSNCQAPFMLSQAAVPFLKAQQGCIVNITDVHAEHPLSGYAAYSVAKAGLLMQTKVLAKALGPEVRVNAVAPGAVAWPEGGNVLDYDKQQAIIAKTVLKRAGQAEDVAKAVQYLVMDAIYTTGQVLHVDGGRYL